VLNKAHAVSETVNIIIEDIFNNAIFNNNIFRSLKEIVWVTGIYATLTETINMNENNNRRRAVIRLLTETIDITEINNRFRALSRMIGEDINITQFSGRFRFVSRIIGETLNIQEINNRFRALSRMLGESTDRNTYALIKLWLLSIHFKGNSFGKMISNHKKQKYET
jgi:hypothetical protein